MNRSVRMLGAALSAALLALGLASPALADTINVVGSASGQASTATTVCEFNSQTNTFTFTITNTSAITQPGSTSTITAIGFDLPPTGNASASGLNGFTGMQAPSLSSSFVFSDAGVGAVPGFPGAVLDFAFLTGVSGTFSDGSAADGLLPGESASFTVSGAAFTGFTEAEICNAIFVRFVNVPTAGTDVAVPPPAAMLTIVKVTNPASDPQDFDFDLTGSGLPADLDLDTDGGSAGTPSEETFVLSAAQLGAHTVSESAVGGWSLTGLECTGGGSDSSTNVDTRVATLDIDQGENVVCTFTNTKHATLTVVKETVPASDPQDFDFDLTGAGHPADVDLDTDAASAGTPSEESFTLSVGQLGAHTVSESAVAGWALIALECTGAGNDSSTNLESRTATLDIDAGETVECTFTNTSEASLTIRKVTDPASDPQDFDFDLTGAGVPGDLDLDTDAGSGGTPSETVFTLSAAQLGAHTVSESATAGWSLTALACSGAGGDSSTDLGTGTATLDIDVGENVVCTFTNTKDASLTIAKVTSPSSDAQDFDFDLTGAGVPADLDLDTDPGSGGTPGLQSFTLDGASLGAYTIIESSQAGWSLTALSCTGAGGDSSTDLGTRTATLDVDAGEIIVCIFTNTKASVVGPSPSVSPSAQGVGSRSAAPTLPPTSTDAPGQVNGSRIAPILLVLTLTIVASVVAVRTPRRARR